MWIKGGILLNDNFQFEQADLITNGEVIADIGNCCGEDILDATDCYVVPGFVDTHMHGAMGKTFLEFDDETYETIASFEAKQGTTSLVPALSAATEDKLISAVKTLVECAKNPKANCTKIHGIHLEGPFFSVRYKGAHLPENIRNPQPEETARLLEAAEGYLKIVTMAPELPGADDAIKFLVQNGVCVSAGHTDASYDEVCHGVDMGITQGTHLFNAMRPLTHREPGTVGALLSIPSVKCEIICDFVHIHPTVVKLAIESKGIDKINLITDSEIAAGMPDGGYALNGRTLTVKESKIYTEDGSLAGGYSCLIDCVRNLVSIGFSLEDACKMASKNPSESVGIYDRVGSLTVGKTADILVLDKKLELKHVVIRGRLLF